MQKKRGQAAERNVTINDEVSKLVKAEIMREVHYHDWLSNPVMVKKSDNSWRMCIDFKDLNKACPKDGYPLPKIDWKVESLCGFPFKCFLDAYKRYHQIQMAEEDEEKTAFITNQGRRRIKPLVTKMLERRAEVKWKIGKLKQWKGQLHINTNEGTYSKVAYAHRSRRTRGTHCLPGSIQGGGECRTNDGKGSHADANLLWQVLADFIIERPKDEGQDNSAKEEEPLPARWTLFTDGSSCIDGCGAEYEALIAGLRIAEKMGVRNLEVNVDSKLVANQVNGTYIAKEADMIKYLEKVRALTSTFRAFSIKQVLRSKNKKADALSKMASTSFAHLSKQVLVEELKEKSVNEREVLAVVEEFMNTSRMKLYQQKGKRQGR
ncbi:reverse transcriptase domain-containing protein [Tanacetum coccineum]